MAATSTGGASRSREPRVPGGSATAEYPSQAWPAAALPAEALLAAGHTRGNRWLCLFGSLA